MSVFARQSRLGNLVPHRPSPSFGEGLGVGFQIEAKALRKLRHPTRSKQLRSFYQ